jgi:hypothetical protein
MSDSDQFRLLAMQEEAERLRELLDELAGDPQIETMRALLRDVQHALELAARTGAEAGLFREHLPWWKDWQCRHGAARAPARHRPAARRSAEETAPTGETRLAQAERHVHEGRARIARQRALRERLAARESPALIQADALLHTLLKTQVMAEVHLLMLLNPF